MQLDQHLLSQIRALAHQAGDHIKHFYSQHLSAQIKEDNTPVTAADLFVSQFLTEQLNARFPDIPVLSEESCAIPLSERQSWARYWIIDPLDGTQQFINRTDQFSVMIALVENHRPVLGVIHAPLLNISYFAMRGFGAWKASAQGVVQLQARAIDLTKPLRIAVGPNAKQEQIRSFLPQDFPVEFIVLGSSSLKSGLVAEGGADCYVRLGKTGEWDTAPAEVLLGEIGGAICDYQFQPLSYNQRESLINPPFLMTANAQLDWRSIFQFN